MCTLVVAHRVLETAPVVVLANRDELLQRPSLAPAVRGHDPEVFCGVDAKEGGTWFGVNAFGVVVGLTNLTLRAPDPSLRSRGLLCMDMLRLPSARGVHDALRRLAPSAYNPFNLVALDGSTAVRASYDDAPIVEILSPGVFATTNWPVQGPNDTKRVATQERVRRMLATTTILDRVQQGLEQQARRHDHDGDSRASVCCHAPGYGTRASSIVFLNPAKRRVRVLHADGAPCETPYEDRTAQVGAMLRFKAF